MLKLAKGRLSGNGGITMIELIVGMLIFAIFSACLLLVTGPMLNNYVDTVEMADVSTLASNLTEEITNELMFAKDVKFYNNSSASTLIAFTRYGEGSDYIQYGVFENPVAGKVSSTDIYRLFRNGKPVFDEAYYRSCTVRSIFSCDVTGGAISLFHVTLVITDRNGVSQLTKEFEVKPIGIAQLSDWTLPDPMATASP